MDLRVNSYLIDRRGNEAPTLWRVADKATHEGLTMYELEDSIGVRSQVGSKTNIYVHKTISLDADFIEDGMKHGDFEVVYPKVDIPAHLDEQMDEHLASKV